MMRGEDRHPYLIKDTRRERGKEKKKEGVEIIQPLVLSTLPLTHMPPAAPCCCLCFVLIRTSDSHTNTHIIKQHRQTHMYNRAHSKAPQAALAYNVWDVLLRSVCVCVCVLHSVGVPARVNTVCQNVTVWGLHTSITNNPFSRGERARACVCWDYPERVGRLYAISVSAWLWVRERQGLRKIYSCVLFCFAQSAACVDAPLLMLCLGTACHTLTLHLCNWQPTAGLECEYQQNRSDASTN